MLALIAPLASLLGIEMGALKERLQRQAWLYGAVGLFLSLGGIFLLVALNSGLSLTFGPVVAPLVIAGAALLVGLVIYLVSLISDNIAGRQEAERKRRAETTALVTTAAISAVPILFKSGLMKKIGIPMGGALAAAYLLTRNNGHHD